MKTYIFKIVLERDEDFDGKAAGWHVYCPVLENKGASTWGETKEEALENIREVLGMMVEEMNGDGEPIPTDPEGNIQIFEDPYVALTL